MPVCVRLCTSRTRTTWQKITSEMEQPTGLAPNNRKVNNGYVLFTEIKIWHKIIRTWWLWDTRLVRHFLAKNGSVGYICRFVNSFFFYFGRTQVDLPFGQGTSNWHRDTICVHISKLVCIRCGAWKWSKFGLWRRTVRLWTLPSPKVMD